MKNFEGLKENNDGPEKEIPAAGVSDQKDFTLPRSVSQQPRTKEEEELLNYLKKVGPDLSVGPVTDKARVAGSGAEVTEKSRVIKNGFWRRLFRKWPALLGLAGLAGADQVEAADRANKGKMEPPPIYTNVVERVETPNPPVYKYEQKSWPIKGDTNATNQAKVKLPGAGEPYDPNKVEEKKEETRTGGGVTWENGLNRVGVTYRNQAGWPSGGSWSGESYGGFSNTPGSISNLPTAAERQKAVKKRSKSG